MYLYDTYLSPFLVRNEAEIDAHIASARSNILTFLQSRLAGVFQAVYQGLTNAQTQAAQNAEARGKAPPQPVLGVPTQLASNLYGFVGSVLAGSIAKANAPAAQQQQQANAQRIAEFLEAHGFAVRYPGLASHPQHDLHARLARGAGAVLSFETGDVGISERIVEAVSVPDGVVGLE